MQHVTVGFTIARLITNYVCFSPVVLLLVKRGLNFDEVSFMTSKQIHSLGQIFLL